MLITNLITYRYGGQEPNLTLMFQYQAGDSTCAVNHVLGYISFNKLSLQTNTQTSKAKQEQQKPACKVTPKTICNGKKTNIKEEQKQKQKR